MNRREFITLLGGAAAAWPLAARAQQPERMRRIGVLLPVATDDAEFQTRVGAFLQALQQLDWTIERNVEIDIRWDADAIRRHAAELAALAPDVILAAATKCSESSGRSGDARGRLSCSPDRGRLPGDRLPVSAACRCRSTRQESPSVV